jgi:hypothetical protein
VCPTPLSAFKKAAQNLKSPVPALQDRDSLRKDDNAPEGDVEAAERVGG